MRSVTSYICKTASWERGKFLCFCTLHFSAFCLHCYAGLLTLREQQVVRYLFQTLGENSGMARWKPAVPAELSANEQGTSWSRSVIITSLAALSFLCIQLSTPPGILSSLFYIIQFSNRLFIEWNNGEKPQS